VGVLIPGVETTKENGATLVIPGSHLWGDDRAPTYEECTYATMVPGEALVFLGSTYHAGGTNATKDQNRPMHGLFFVRGVTRSEENQYYTYPPEEVAKWSKEAKVRAGLGLSNPNIGFVDLMSSTDYADGKRLEDFECWDSDAMDSQLESKEVYEF